MTEIDWDELELKWEKRWKEAKIFEADPDPKRKKCFVTFPFSYMNAPLHVGHGFTATRVDAYARFKRMQGYNVLFPWAWHWTGTTILGAAQRIARGDQFFISVMRDVVGVPEEELEKMKDPVYMARYFTRESKRIVDRIGFSVDWRREFHTTSLHPQFSRFIEWQYWKLREKGYVIKGKHPVVWCPNCESPTGDHDRLEGEGVVPEEYILMKFPIEDSYLVAATFRPETIYGVTNLWLHPDATYVKAEVDGEKWIISKEAAEKLKEQKEEIKILSEFKGSELIGKTCLNPINKKELPILPGWFVDPNQASGVVYSVPAHAPYDWLALRDLMKKPELLKEFDVDPKILEEIKPISMIRLEGFGDYPAIELVDKMGVKDQHDPKAEEATEIIYKKEFHTGVMKEICGKYAGMPVRQAKTQVIEDLKEQGIADSMYDLPKKVVCRCMTNCIVKILKDQWFLNYSNPEWKALAKEAINRAKIYPEEARQWFLDVIDWYRDWACARQSGLGTPLPWNPKWIVETLSDSTIYMAFYTIAKYINEYKIEPEKLTLEVFDYIFLGKGDPKEVSEKSGLDLELLEAMRNEFLYWYPVDLRNSAKELLPNHLTFFVFHHVAIFPREHWPRAIAVNGMVMVEGKKMSKSKGNFVTLKAAISKYGADATRAALLLSAEGMDDPDWRAKNAENVKRRLEALLRMAREIASMPEGGEPSFMERWLLSVLQGRIKRVTEAMEELKTRTALENALYEVWNDIRWYMRRGGNHGPTLRKALSIWARLMAPFIPHTCEEIWSMLGEEGFISTAPWPKPDPTLVDVEAEEAEKLVENTLEDTQSIVKVMKTKPKHIYYYVASGWKWQIYLKALEAVEEGKTLKELMQEIMKVEEMRSKAREASKFAQSVMEDARKMSRQMRKRLIQVGKLNEQKILEEAKAFLEKELNAEITVYHEEDPQKHDPKNRAKLAKPHRPAIYIEQ